MSDRPAAWLLDNRDLWPHRGLVLDVACGQGRHAILLAQTGLQVRAIDRNAEAIDALRHDAGARGLQIDAAVVDLETDPPPSLGESLYDAVLVFNYLHRPLMPALREAVKPGGRIFYETFTTRQAERGHPRNPAFLLRGRRAAGADGAVRDPAIERRRVRRPLHRVGRCRARTRDAARIGDAVTMSRRLMTVAALAVVVGRGAGSVESRQRRMAHLRRRSRPTRAIRALDQINAEQLQQARGRLAIQDRQPRPATGIQVRVDAADGQRPAVFDRRHAAGGGRARRRDRRNAVDAQRARRRARRRRRLDNSPAAASRIGPTASRSGSST